VSLRTPEAIDRTIGEELNGMGEHGWEAIAWIPNPKTPDEGYMLLKMLRTD
jgi:hypothetical protein